MGLYILLVSVTRALWRERQAQSQPMLSVTEREDVCSKQNYADRECESLWTASDGHCHNSPPGRLLFPTVRLRGQQFIAFS